MFGDERNCAAFAAAELGLTVRIPDLAEGLRRLRAAGYRDHVDFLDRSGCRLAAPLLARPGDIALFEGRALGVVIDYRAAVLRPDGTRGLAPLEAAEAVWRIDRNKIRNKICAICEN